ncbi:Adaptin ear-binding coat-associated protein 1 [Hondaea fermentalgiana]|uniref:Adaptin ear-binding coat-associated protein 1 n=1 Tax=Hondaea fermentalgiana TaxID=2315210 RepID=A0A2R5GHP2_9STRA|nr:Adaptin ear-binding coat-associated protein 1 [Hondaea fermentalgiana]|eukprot:GBG27394.1 Adaptin ear-binding coat-associated protein 1 [Hondaea fermentalgiana]
MSGAQPTGPQDEDTAAVLHLLTIKEVFVYKIPPLQGSRGHHAADWNLDKPALTGQLRVISKGDKVYLQILQLPESSAGLPQLFASCPIKLDTDASKPASKLDYFVQSVVDSSRYFVIRVQDEVSKRHAYIGIGFQERQSAFDLRAALDDEVRRISRGEHLLAAEDDESNDLPPVDAPPAVDRSLKEGETIKVKLNIGGSGTARKKPGAKTGGSLKLKPPKSSSRVRAPPGTTAATPAVAPAAAPAAAPAPAPAPAPASSAPDLGDSFAGLSLAQSATESVTSSVPPTTSSFEVSSGSQAETAATASASDPFDEFDFGEFQS